MYCVLKYDARYECWDIVSKHANPCAGEVAAHKARKAGDGRYELRFITKERLALDGTQGYRSGY
jgi:hypothetical protein